MSVTSKTLENFILENQVGLETIKQSFNEFNIFNVLGIQYREIRHSNFLGWLFDPNESHQLDDIFLKDLFKLMDKVGVFQDNELVSYLLKDLSKTQVYRESVHNIDILIVNESLGFVICIENKIYADFSDHQLEKYYNYVEENYQLCNRYYLTLTPFRNENHKNYTAGENYTNISYGDIVESLENQQSNINKAIPPVRESINQYTTMCARSITKSGNEVKLAQEIYKKYKNEIEFIINNKPDFLTKKNYLTRKFKAQEVEYFNFVDNKDYKNIIRFLPKNEQLVNLFTDKRFNSWEGDKIFCLELHLNPNNAWVKWCFGNIATNDPNQELHAKRSKMINTMKGFNCFKSSDINFDSHSANVNDDYPGIGGVALLSEAEFLNSEIGFFTFFKEKLNELNEKLIEPWVDECIEKL